jgi:putative peptidoglycan binding protein
MVGREEPSHATVDPDDWFGGSDDSLDETWPDDHAPAQEPAWVDDAGENERAAPAGRPARVSPRALAVLVASAVVLILAVLAAAGVFSSSATTPTTAQTTTGSATTPTPTQRTPTTPTPAPVTVPTVVLKPGMTGADVKALQRALASAGHSPGSVDGVYGPKTEQAVSAFQQAQGITVDGVYGAETQKALDQQIKSG